MKQMTAEIKLKQYFETTDMNYSKNSQHTLSSRFTLSSFHKHTLYSFLFTIKSVITLISIYFLTRIDKNKKNMF